MTIATVVITACSSLLPFVTKDKGKSYRQLMARLRIATVLLLLGLLFTFKSQLLIKAKVYAY